MSNLKVELNPHSTRRSQELPQIVHRDTLLKNLPARIHPYVLISDDAGDITGVVPSQEIDRRLLSPNPFEKSRWSDMPIGALARMRFSSLGNGGPASTGDEISCSTLRTGDSLFALSAEGELFFSWKKMESLFSAALSDPLTGLLNRLAYERRIQEEWNRSLRTHTSIGVVVMDLDSFKSINDTFGHVIGDQVLAAVGKRLEASMRSYDVVSRFGGDEFVALCLGCSEGSIEIPIQRFASSLDEFSFSVEGQIVPVHASIGAAVRHEGFGDHLPQDLFAAADNCLYEAKESRHRAWTVEFGASREERPRPVLNELRPKSARRVKP